MTRLLSSSSARPPPLVGASPLARGAPSIARPATAGERAPAAPAARLQKLERLDVDQVLVLPDDVRLPHRLQELLRPVEVPQADLDAAEALGHVAVRARPR